MRFQGKNVLLGVTGGVAAYKAVSLLRLLKAEGADVRVLLTPAAEKMAGKGAFEALSGHGIPNDVFRPVENPERSSVAHIELARWADLLIVAPCTANTLAKFACGIADDLLPLVFLATKAPKIVAPSMNTAMYESPAVRRNVKTLRNDGAIVVEAGCGALACGETGKGRMPEPEELLEAAFDAVSPDCGRTAVVVAGRTEEPIDDVRAVTNKSSGKTGLEVARAFRAAGWRVRTVLGPCETPYPAWCDVVRVQTALEMEAAAKTLFQKADAIVMAAAVADFRPAKRAKGKIKRSCGMKSIELVPNPDILAGLSKGKRNGRAVAGFALETSKPLERGVEKILAKGCDLLVVNNPLAAEDSGFGEDRVEWGLLRRHRDCVEESVPLAMRPKSELAAALVAEIEAVLDGRAEC